jgi:hypothetical protein
MGLRLCVLRRATEHHTQPVNDIQIRSLGYDRRRGRLEIEFTWTDDVRQFYPVVLAVYRQLLAAKPMYLFLHQNSQAAQSALSVCPHGGEARDHDG